MRARGEDGVLLSGLLDGGVVAVAGEDESIAGERVQPLGDGGDVLLQPLGAVGVAGAAGEPRGAGDEVTVDQEAAASGCVPRRVDHQQAQPAHRHAVAVGQGAVDLLRGQHHLRRVAEDGGVRGPLHQVVLRPVVRVGVREEDGDDPQAAGRLQRLGALDGHIHDDRLRSVAVGDDVGVIGVGSQRPHLGQSQGTVLENLHGRLLIPPVRLPMIP